MLETTIAGSLPKPTWLAQPNALFAPWLLKGEQLAEAQDDAVRLVLADQEDAGIDVDNLGSKLARGGRYTPQTAVARIVGEVTWSGPVLAEAVRFARAHTTRRLKVTLPGPMTTVDSLLDEHYGTDEKTLAMRF